MRTRILCLAAMAVFLIFAAEAAADPVDQTIHYTRKLPAKWTYPRKFNFKFSLWDVASDGEMVWSEEKKIYQKMLAFLVLQNKHCLKSKKITLSGLKMYRSLNYL